MRALGFEELLPTELQSGVITTFHYLDDPRFDFEALYRGLSERGLVIYPGKLGELDCFRVGTCGHLGADDVDRLLAGVRAVLGELGVALPATARTGGPR
jgi:2-aminoethylphosphonate-pyruvate transaminase